MVRPRLMSVNEVSAYLGVPVNTIYGWNSRGGGPRFIRVGRHVRFRREDVETWLAQNASASDRPVA